MSTWNPRHRRITITPILAAAALAVLSAGCGSQASADSTHRYELSDPPAAINWKLSTATATRATGKLTADLLAENVDQAGNAVISPYSIEQALTRLATGARGRTASQIAHVLGAGTVGGIDNASAVLNTYFAQTTSTTTSRTKPQLSNANSIWLSKSLAVKPSFLDNALNSTGTSVRRINFAGDPDGARETINNWVAAETRNQIKQLFPTGSIDSNTLLALVNAIYLKARWASPFDKSLTVPASFHTAAGTTTQPEFMTLDEPQSFKLARTDGYTAVDLPYAGNNLSMLLVMPKQTSLRKFVTTLTPASLTAMAQNLKSKTILLWVPRFSIALNTSLNAQLIKLGMSDAFSESKANFSGISAQSMYVGTVQHAATLKVFEQGTIASAATGISVEGSSGISTVDIPKIRFNHPFLALIRDRVTGAILFAATVGDPTAA